MLAEAPVETNEIENKALKRNLATKLEHRKSPIPEQTPHGCFSVGWFTAHRLCEIANALGGLPMVWRPRLEPLARRLTA